MAATDTMVSTRRRADFWIYRHVAQHQYGEPAANDHTQSPAGARYEHRVGGGVVRDSHRRDHGRCGGRSHGRRVVRLLVGALTFVIPLAFFVFSPLGRVERYLAQHPAPEAQRAAGQDVASAAALQVEVELGDRAVS